MATSKVRVHEDGADTPSAQIIAKAAAEQTVTAPDGRTFTLKRPNVLAQYDLVEMVGGEAASNATYMAMVLPLLYLSAIDGERVKPPQSKRELRALIQRLDEDGIGALGEGVRKHYGQEPGNSEADAVKNG